MRASSLALLLLCFAAPQAVAQMPNTPPLDPDTWTFTADIPLVSKWPAGREMREDRITADLFRPKRDGKVPAAVIINSSGGVTAHTELFYGRLLASNGVAALVVDSFMPRGVRRTTDDQSRVWQLQSNSDAVAGYRWLAAQSWIDSSRIIVMGMSRGGHAALAMALETDRKRANVAREVRFAAHIAITPGGCTVPRQDARTTGAPIFFMLADLDDYTPARDCLSYIERMRAAGNSNIQLAVYPGVSHALESIGGLVEDKVELWHRCRMEITSDNQWYDRGTNKIVPEREVRAYALRHCIDNAPVTEGGEPRVKWQAVADLLQFLKDVEVVEDREARAVVPECSAFPQSMLRRNCLRARAGRAGDLVALARAYRQGNGVQRDDGRAAALFRLAADRAHPQAQWELSVMMRRGVGTAPDLPAALSLARTSAAAGEPAAMNILGIMASDGAALPRDDNEAVKWFRAAADLRHSYALANLGRMYWLGHGGLNADRAEAVRLWRKSVYYDNPLGQLYLGEALEKGEGAGRDIKQALELYRTAASQERDADVKRRAIDALARLSSEAKQKP
jgi:TPR repeat protein/dienelactone hydrolase